MRFCCAYTYLTWQWIMSGNIWDGVEEYLKSASGSWVYTAHSVWQFLLFSSLVSLWFQGSIAASKHLWGTKKVVQSDFLPLKFSFTAVIISTFTCTNVYKTLGSIHTAGIESQIYNLDHIYICILHVQSSLALVEGCNYQHEIQIYSCMYVHKPIFASQLPTWL